MRLAHTAWQWRRSYTRTVCQSGVNLALCFDALLIPPGSLQCKCWLFTLQTLLLQTHLPGMQGTEVKGTPVRGKGIENPGPERGRSTSETRAP